MSLIYEALQKIEKRPSYKTSPKNKERHIFLFLLLIAISAGIIYISIPKNTPVKTATINTKTEQNLVKEYSRQTNKEQIPDKPQTFSYSEPPISFYKKLMQKEEKLRLSGIIYSPDKAMAVINGRIVGQGETIAKAEVLKITEKSVELNRNNEKIILTLDLP
ncbi:MAG: hypothetical protein JW734_08255 [Candidatus Omnitrophica bacterium]|nr:hypothetical protein [Candidatus Omnitrophota bacterium]